MITVGIFIFDQKLKELERENLELGFEKHKIPECKVTVTNLYLDQTLISAFWVDPDVDDDIQDQKIVFYCGGVTYSTLFTKKTFDLFTDILKNRDNI